MSPEQLEGEEADARSDLFSFGCVLYEVLTGRRAFEGSSSASVIAAIRERDPAPIEVARPLDRVVRRSLAKDPDQRFQTARDLKAALGWAMEQPAPAGPARSSYRWWIASTIAFAVLAAGIAGGRWLGRSTATGAPELRPLTYSGHDSSPAASPDGRTVAFSSDRDGIRRIWLKDLGSGSENALTAGGSDDHPRFSPDGSMIVFTRGPVAGSDLTSASSSLYRVAMVGGEPRKLVADAIMGEWSPDGRQIAFVRRKTESWAVGLVGADGAYPQEMAQVNGGSQGVRYPRWSPDGRTIAFAVGSTGSGISWPILLVNADGKGSRSISSPPGGFRISSVAWSGGSGDIVYSQGESLVSNNAVPSAGTARVILQNIHSGAAQTLFRIPNNSATFDVVGPGRVVFDSFSSRQNL